MSHKPTSDVSYGFPLGSQLVAPDRDRAIERAASREESGREAAFLRDMSGMPTTPQPSPPELRQPTLPNGFADALDSFDADIHARGIAVSRDKILALGRTRFEQLLLLDRAARMEQRVVGPATDLTSWYSVHQAFAAANALNTGIPKRKTSEVWVGAGEDRERAGQIAGFDDLWKSVTEPRAARAILAFRDKFESLLLGMSMLEQISDDGKIHHKTFSSGKPAGAFTDWLSVLEQPCIAVTLLDPIGDVMTWLANEQTPAPRPLEYAKELFGIRAPSAGQIKVAAAVWRSFILGYTSPWDIFDFVGRQTRIRTETITLETWRNDLRRQYPRIAQFHNELRNYFFKPLGGNQYQFDGGAHRQFLNDNIRKLSNRLSAITAMAIEAALPESVVARFSDSILAVTTDRVKHKAKLDAYIYQKLQAAFPRSDVQLRIEG
jgi:hypothetical protein